MNYTKRRVKKIDKYKFFDLNDKEALNIDIAKKANDTTHIK